MFLCQRKYNNLLCCGGSQMSRIEESGFPMILIAALSFSTLFPKAQNTDIEIAGSLPIWQSSRFRQSRSILLFVLKEQHHKASTPTSLHYYSHSRSKELISENFSRKGNSTMNNGSGSKNRGMMGLHLKGRKERDSEDLHLFRELHKRDKERTTGFLLPVVHDLEHNNGGNSPFYRIQSIRKESGFELLSEGNTNDYDWLKTPPATPLFPSLEMEAIASHMNPQKEAPLVQPLSKPQSQASTKRSNGVEKKIPSRSITPSHRPRINSSIEPKNTKRTTTPSRNPNQSISQASSTDPTIKRNNNMKSVNLKESYTDYLTSNLSKGSTNTARVKPSSNSNPNPNPNPRSRTTSPIVRSTIASQIQEFSNETPPNLRRDRSNSVTRGRQVGMEQKSEGMNINSRRQSCSPSVTRGRKVEGGGNLRNDQRRTESTNILGSRMVERVMNARKVNGNEDRDLKARGRSGIGDLGFMPNAISAAKTSTKMIRKK